MGIRVTTDYLREYSPFAGFNGGGGNRTRVGSEAERRLLQEKRRSLAESTGDKDGWIWAFRIYLRDATETIGRHTTTNLYVVFDGDTAKIGIADDPLKRLKNLQVSNPRPLILYAAAPANAQLEKFVHQQLAHERVRGEWFQGPHTDTFAEEALSWTQMLAMIVADDVDGDVGVDDTVCVSTSRIDDAIWWLEQSGQEVPDLLRPRSAA